MRWAKLLYEGDAIDGDYVTSCSSRAIGATTPKRSTGWVSTHYQTAFGPAYGHGGWIPGYNSAVSYFPNQRFAIAVQINRSFDNDLLSSSTDGRRLSWVKDTGKPPRRGSCSATPKAWEPPGEWVIQAEGTNYCLAQIGSDATP